jgi:hypothetical protein
MIVRLTERGRSQFGIARDLCSQIRTSHMARTIERSITRNRRKLDHRSVFTGIGGWNEQNLPTGIFAPTIPLQIARDRPDHAHDESDHAPMRGRP